MRNMLFTVQPARGGAERQFALIIGDVGQSVPHGEPAEPVRGMEADLKRPMAPVESRVRVGSALPVGMIVDRTLAVFREPLR